jgi:hypothetical protein
LNYHQHPVNREALPQARQRRARTEGFEKLKELVKQALKGSESIEQQLHGKNL